MRFVFNAATVEPIHARIHRQLAAHGIDVDVDTAATITRVVVLDILESLLPRHAFLAKLELNSPSPYIKGELNGISTLITQIAAGYVGTGRQDPQG